MPPLVDGHAAVAARTTLADAAERSLDIQYYIWPAEVVFVPDLPRTPNMKVMRRVIRSA